MANDYIVIPCELIRNKILTNTELYILVETNQLSMLEYGCIASNEHFAKKFGIKRESVSRAINSLVQKGYINSKIKNGSRNFSRALTLNKMLFNPKQNVIPPLTNCLETKENITSNKTKNIYEDFLEQLSKVCKYKTKVTKTKEGLKAFKLIEDKQQLFKDYKQHQESKDNYAVVITKFMIDYDTVYKQENTTQKWN